MKQYIQVTGGRGPIECASVVNKVVGFISTQLKKSDVKVDLIEREPHNDNPNLSMSFVIGFEAEEMVVEDLKKEWSGTIKYVATRDTLRPGHKRKNWFVGVNFYKELDLPEIDEKDIKYEAFRSGGAGGQNVNKVSSAVRATYIPSGLSASSQDERDQPRNKVIAKERLLFKLKAINDKKREEQEKENWNNHNTLERGNPIKTIKGEV